MTIRLTSHFAVCALAMSMLTIGCKPGGRDHVASVSSRAPSARKAAAQFAAMGETAMRGRNGPLAVAMAERAVASQPGVARYRAQLGQSYLLAGRFASAVDAFRDAIAVAPDDGRAMLGMALGQAALDRRQAARASVAAADGRIGAPDRGLALALAGDSDGAIALLEPATRRTDASPRTRQNLALAYALAGRWGAARATAAQDVPADQLDARLQAWAALARPQPRMARVATFLGVTPAAVDEGMPMQLALGRVQSVPASASPAVAIAAQDVPAAVASQRLFQPEPAVIAMVTHDPATPVTTGPARDDAPSARHSPAVSRTVVPGPVPLPFASAWRGVVPAVRLLRAPARVAPPALVMRGGYTAPVSTWGHWAVQLGAFSGRRSIEDAWNRLRRTVRPVAGMVPLSSMVRTSGKVFWRLSVGGLASRAAAVTLCEQVRASGGVCFVRTLIGEAPMQMARRRIRKVQLASR